MSREQFINNLRVASGLLTPPRVNGGGSKLPDEYLSRILQSTDLWLTAKSVEGFDQADFADWPKKEPDELAKEVAAFLAIVNEVPANEPATKAQTKRARIHLQRVIDVVRRHLLPDWLDAQNRMLDEATAAAATHGWYVERDEKELSENLLGRYKAPRLRIRTRDNEVVLDPIAYFGSGRQGIVDLVIMPTYETMYWVILKDGQWQLVSAHGTPRTKPFNRTTLVKAIAKLTSN
jgi:hypothetical protein